MPRSSECLNEDGQEIPKAFVVIQAGEELTDDEVMQYVTSKRGAAQEGAAGRVHRAHPEVDGGEDPAQGPPRQGNREVLTPRHHLTVTGWAV